jgi:ELWxxDGT repeat protein
LSLTNVNGRLFFRANNGINGEELWVMDGGAEPVVSVPGVALTGINGPGVLGTGVPGAGLPGLGVAGVGVAPSTPQSTLALIDIVSGAGASTPNNFTNVNGIIFFVATTTVEGKELWKTDGTLAGTALVKDIRPGATGSFPTNLTNVGGRLYFTASDGVAGAELWKSNGVLPGPCS